MTEKIPRNRALQNAFELGMEYMKRLDSDDPIPGPVMRRSLALIAGSCRPPLTEDEVNIAAFKGAAQPIETIQITPPPDNSLN